MIKLTFLTPQNQIMYFRVENREIFYCDKFFTKEIRLIPKDTDFIKKVIASRNKLPRQLITMFNLSDKDKSEYDGAATDEALKEIIVKDCKGKGLRLIKEKK